jgi:hypothetical protein
MAGLEIFKLELFKKLMDLITIVERLRLLLDGCEVTFYSGQDGVLGGVVAETLVHDRFEVGAFLLVQAVHVRVEVRVGDHTLQVSGH